MTGPGGRGPGGRDGVRSPGGTRIGVTGPGGRGPGGRDGVRVPGGRDVVRGPGGVRGPGIAVIGDRRVTVWRGPRRIWIGSGWRTLVPVTALGAIYIGSRYYDPDGYVAVARPRCSGFTEDGCRLEWRPITTADGFVEYQCVQYCPRGDLPPPAVVVAPPPQVTPPPQPPVAVVSPPPPAPDAPAKCRMTIFAEPGLTGLSAEVEDEEAQLSEAGWAKEIASIEIVSGTWEFFTEENFGGDMMRLGPGKYERLDPAWVRQISSFMCVE